MARLFLTVDRLHSSADYLAGIIENRLTPEAIWMSQDSFAIADAAKIFSESADSLRNFVQQSFNDMAVTAGLPEIFASTGAGVAANFVAAPLLGELERTSHIFEVVGIAVGLVLNLHPLVIACAKPLLHDKAGELVAQQIESLLVSPDTRGEDPPGKPTEARKQDDLSAIAHGPKSAVEVRLEEVIRNYPGDLDTLKGQISPDGYLPDVTPGTTSEQPSSIWTHLNDDDDSPPPAQPPLA